MGRMRSRAKLLLTTACLFLSACGGGGENAPTGGTPGTAPAGTQAAAPLKVGLLLTGSSSDGGWNQLADASLKSLAKQMPIDSAVRQQVSKDAAADAIRQFDAQGFQLIICHGYEYQDAAKELTDPAKGEQIKAKIAVSSGDLDKGGFAAMCYDLSQASYQMGVIAGKLSKTGKLAFIGGEPFPTLTAMKRGFEAGAKSINPNATVASQYTGWDDPSKAKKQCEAFMEQGVDIIAQDLDAAGRGVFEAVQEHNAKADKTFTAYTFGANADQNNNPVCPDYTLASAVIRIDVAMKALAEQVQAGTFKGGRVDENVTNGVCICVLNPKLLGTTLPADTEKTMTDITDQFKAGKITIPAEQPTK